VTLSLVRYPDTVL